VLQITQQLVEHQSGKAIPVGDGAVVIGMLNMIQQRVDELPNEALLLALDLS